MHIEGKMFGTRNIDRDKENANSGGDRVSQDVPRQEVNTNVLYFCFMRLKGILSLHQGSVAEQRIIEYEKSTISLLNYYTYVGYKFCCFLGWHQGSDFKI